MLNALNVFDDETDNEVVNDLVDKNKDDKFDKELANSEN
jgi:hypothetical protein